jgi:molybdopterin molybdotransferase
MITVDEALKIVLDSSIATGSEYIGFSESLGRILAEDVRSDVDMPPFNRSAVDGYACRIADIGNELEVVETIRAGMKPEKNVNPGQCSKIMTGSIVPDGCDVVFMVENSKTLPSGKVICSLIEPKRNMSLRAEDVKRGDVVLSKGRQIEPQDIAVFSSVGYTTVKVAKRPAIGILSTGAGPGQEGRGGRKVLWYSA